MSVQSSDTTKTGGAATLVRDAPKLPALGVLLIGALISAVVFLIAQGRDRSANQHDFDRMAGDVATALVNGLDVPLESLHAVPALFASSESVSREEFRVFVQPTLDRHPAIYAFEWLPEVPDADRDRWVTRARDEGLPGFRFTEVGKELGMVPAKSRPIHVPIFYMEPRNHKALGFDIASDAARLEPFERAKRAGRAVASGRIRLVEDPPGVHSIAIFEPVFRRTEGGARIFDGCAVEVFRVKPIVERALRGYAIEDYALELLDQDSVPTNERPLYDRPLATPASSVEFEKSFPFADRTWTLRMTAPARPRASNLWVLVGGLLTSMLASVVALTLGTIRALRRRVRDAEHLGQYTLVSKLGEGGMGVVYQASHAMLRRPTALKLLRAGHDDEEHHARFEREVQLTSQLTHPNTIAVYDYGQTPDGISYYAMEYIEGIDFERLVAREGPLPPGRVVFLLRQVLGALAEAHAVGLIHRDIKPANLMVCRRGGISDFVKVLDFGLAKQLGQLPSSVSRGEILIGTPHYLAPESIRGEDVGPRADLYALGAVAYFLLTGHTVFEGSSVVEIGVQHLQEPPVPPSERLGRPIPKSLEQIVLACLAKDPDERPASAQELLERLESLTDVEPWTERDAARWWDERGAELYDGLCAERASAERTVGVDVRHRTQASSSNIAFDATELAKR